MFKQLLQHNYQFCPKIAFFVILLFALSPTCIYASGGTSFSLVNAETGEIIDAYLDYPFFFNLKELPEKLTIIDEAWSFPEEEIGSVVFYLDGKKIRYENVRPYSLGGDMAGKYNAFSLPIGQSILLAEYYSKPYGQGELLGIASIPLCIVDFEIPKIHFDETTLQVTVPAGMETKVKFNLGFEDTEALFNLQEPEMGNSWLRLESPVHPGENTLIIDAHNLAPSSYTYDDFISFAAPTKLPTCFEASAFGSFKVEVTVIPSDLLLVYGLIIANAETDHDACASFGTGPTSIPTVSTFSTDALCLPDLLTFRADAYGEVGSIMFEYSFTVPGEEEKPLEFLRTENLSPYAVFGDFPLGDYAGIPKASGLYKIRATPFSQAHAKGAKGIPMEVHFRITEPIVYSLGTVKSEKQTELIEPAEEKLTVYPNPVVQDSRISYQAIQPGFVNLTLFDIRGNQVRKIYQGESSPKQTLKINLSREGLQEGIYILRIENENGIKTQRIKIER
ncbi:MAG: T9SS type A sorting domain-containing protein [Microscillaceae bacterium]|nr:T9SS type A sorting domain-containing protein [Microscillaceae bacterium]